MQLTLQADAGMSEVPVNHLAVSVTESLNIAAW